MTIILGILVTYSVLTAPIIGYGLWRALRRRAEADKLTDQQATDLEKVMSAALASQGIKATVHEIPKTATEAIIFSTHQIINAIGETNRAMIAWFKLLRTIGETNKRDMDAVMQSLQAITKGVLEMQESAEKTPEASLETFVHNLEFVRDRFADTPTQKKTMDSIIKSVKTNYERTK